MFRLCCYPKLDLGFILYRYRRCQIEHSWLYPNLVVPMYEPETISPMVIAFNPSIFCILSITAKNFFFYRYRRCQVEHSWLHPNLDIGNRVGSQILDHLESGMTMLDVPKLSAS